MSIAAGQKIKASHIPAITMYNLTQSPATGDLTTTFTDIGGLTQTFTTNYADAKVLLVASLDFFVSVASGSVGALIGAQVVVDGVAQAGQADLDNNQIIRGTTGVTWTGTLAATGSHTIKMQARNTNAGGTAEVQTQSKMTLTVIDQDVS
jgi:Na+/proline symporter